MTRITIRGVSGDVLLAPGQLPMSLDVAELRDEVRKHLPPGCSVRLLYGGRELASSETFEGPDAVTFNNEVELTAVVVHTYAVVTLPAKVEAVAEQLSRGVTKLHSNDMAFAALKEEGGVVTWGYEEDQEHFILPAVALTHGVAKIYNNRSAFAALKYGGAVVTWGVSEHGGDSRAVSKELSSGVTDLCCNDIGFAALKESGKVVTWGKPGTGGAAECVTSLLDSDIMRVYNNNHAFAAVKVDGGVITWGDPERGGHIVDSISEKLASGVIAVNSTCSAFAALKDDGGIVAWGDPKFGGDSSCVDHQLESNVVSIHSSPGTFFALKHSGQVVSWGDLRDFSVSANELCSGVVELKCSGELCAALKQDGAVVTWGGDCLDEVFYSTVADQLRSGVVELQINAAGTLSALKEDRSVVTWGDTQDDTSHSLIYRLPSQGFLEVHRTKREAFAVLCEESSIQLKESSSDSDSNSEDSESDYDPSFFLTGSWNAWELVELEPVPASDTALYRARIQVRGAPGVESFQILLDGDWEQRFYPGPLGSVEGPESVHGVNWNVAVPIGCRYIEVDWYPKSPRTCEWRYFTSSGNELRFHAGRGWQS